MSWLETRVPPPVVTLVVGAIMWSIAQATPAMALRAPGLLEAGVAVAILGVALEVVAALTFRRVCTTVNPLDPSAATSLVSTGVYRLTRNPIYVGDLLVLVGWAIYLGSPVALLATPVFVLYLDRFQIAPEERILAAKFGESYREYQARVRRWI